MIIKQITITQKEITSRDLALLTQRAVRFESEVFLEQGSKKVNAKSIMGVISLGIKDGTVLAIVAKGKDEEQAAEDIAALITRGFVAV